MFLIASMHLHDLYRIAAVKGNFSQYGAGS